MIKLSNLEMSIMHIIWERKEVTAFEILNELNKEKKVAKHTVRTLLSRMIKKKAICVYKKVKKEYIYIPIIDKEAFLRNENLYFLDLVYKGDIRKMLLNYVDEGKLVKKDIEVVLEEFNKEI